MACEALIPGDGRVSAFLPPFFRDALVRAAVAHDIARIDELTDALVDQHPALVVARDTIRPEFYPWRMR